MFGKRIHILTIKGISIGIDLSWLFIAILLTWSLSAGYFPHYYPGLDPATYLFMGLLGMFGLFVSIVLHELGHALTAKYFHFPISRITLFLFGGVAELKKEPTSPKSEFLVAIAGPVVSFALILLFRTIAEIGKMFDGPSSLIAVANYLSLINFVVVLFNLVPAFPLDGGRVLRAFLWWKNGSLGWATKITCQIGSGFGFFLIFLGVFALISGNLLAGIWWMILGLFLQQAATMSQAQYDIGKIFERQKIEKYMVKDPVTVAPDLTINEFLDRYFYTSFHQLYPVVKEAKLLGYISLDEVKSSEKESWNETKVEHILVPLNQVKTLSKNDKVTKALKILQKSPTESILITDSEGDLAGLLCAHDLFKIISLHT